MGVEWTEEQQQVIRLRNRNLLVAAAAGSGKTAVLVERIITMISDEENPVDIDRLLVVTFTKAAASEMRERISKAIEKKVEEHPGSAHLQRQLTLLHHADITTIDSYCLHLIRNYANELDMDPDSLRFDYSEDSLSPAYNVTAAQSKELATLLTLAERLRVHVSAITPDASALQRFLPFLPSHQQCLAWRDNEQWLWATRYSWGRKLAVGMTSAKELAAALCVDPESVALCGEGGFDPWEAVSVRQPPLPPPGGDFAIALGLALGKVY